MEQKLYNFKVWAFCDLKHCFSMVVFNFVSYVSQHMVTAIILHPKKSGILKK